VNVFCRKSDYSSEPSASFLSEPDGDGNDSSLAGGEISDPDDSGDECGEANSVTK
jgi:hypothetical protein